MTHFSPGRQASAKWLLFSYFSTRAHLAWSRQLQMIPLTLIDPVPPC